MASKIADEHKEEFGHKISYNEEYDSYLCKICDIWLDSICPDRTCEYCSKRLELPSMCKG